MTVIETWQQEAERAEPPRSSGGRLRPWLRRLGRSATREQVRLSTLQRLEEVRAVLERAGDIVADGWVQDRGYVPSGGLTSGPVTLFGADRIKSGDGAAPGLGGAAALGPRGRSPLSGPAETRGGTWPQRVWWAPSRSPPGSGTREPTSLLTQVQRSTSPGTRCRSTAGWATRECPAGPHPKGCGSLASET